MGSFVTTCCLTGLPITLNQPMYMGLVMGSYNPHPSGHVGGMFTFIVPPVESVYNWYGNTDWPDIPDNELDVVQFLLEQLKPLLKVKSCKKEDHTLEELWMAVVCQQAYLKVDDELLKSPKYRAFQYDLEHQPVPVYTWMAHKEAADYLISEAFVRPKMKANVKLATTCQSDAGDKCLSSINELSYVTGKNGGIDCLFQKLVWFADKNPFRETLEEITLRTSMLLEGMVQERIAIWPAVTVGDQYDEDHTEWASFVQNLAVQQNKARLEQ